MMFPLASLPRLCARGRVPSPGGAREAKTGLRAPGSCSVPQKAEAENPSVAGACPGSPPVPPPTTVLPLPGGGSQPPAPPPARCPKSVGSGSERSSFVSQCPSQTDQNRIFTEAIKIPGIHRPYDLLNMFLIAKLPTDEKVSPVGYCLAWGDRTGGIFPALPGTVKAGEPGRSGAN